MLKEMTLELLEFGTISQDKEGTFKFSDFKVELGTPDGRDPPETVLLEGLIGVIILRLQVELDELKAKRLAIRKENESIQEVFNAH